MALWEVNESMINPMAINLKEHKTVVKTNSK